MIKIIEKPEDVLGFALSFKGDRNFSDPMLATESQVECNLCKSIKNPGRYCTIGIYEGEALTGLFSFLTLEDERYLEMLVGLSREESAYREMMAFIKTEYPGYQADFVYNPGNHLLHGILEKQNAYFFPEQIKMVLREIVPYTGDCTVVPYSEPYRGEYCRLHDENDDGAYWSAEKLLEATDKFRVFLALRDGKAVGYIDVTYCFDENEPYDLYVSKEYRRQGFARALLARAVEENKPNTMMLLVDVDNTPAIELYNSMGFQKDELAGNQTARIDKL